MALQYSPQSPRSHRINPTRLLVSITLTLTLASSWLHAQDKQPDFKVPDDIAFRAENIISEGTQMAAEVFSPKNPGSERQPTIIMSHGWGGTASALRPDAIIFARAGYLVIAFDYRGWGNSDSRVIAVGKPELKDGKLIAEVKPVREVVDPIDQTTDILNAIHWAASDKQCDPERIGIGGSSFSGGHVVYVAARDPRVKAFVSQVGSMDGRWAVESAPMRRYTFSQGAARTRGTIGYPKPGEKFGSMTGAPGIEKLIGYAPIEDIGRCGKCAKLFLIAENEELFDNKDHAILAHERATGVKKLVTVKGIKHYGIYNEARDQAQKETVAWFDEHLKQSKSLLQGQVDAGEIEGASHLVVQSGRRVRLEVAGVSDVDDKTPFRADTIVRIYIHEQTDHFCCRHDVV